jgi:hypothetical protein
MDYPAYTSEVRITCVAIGSSSADARQKYQPVQYLLKNLYFVIMFGLGGMMMIVTP